MPGPTSETFRFQRSGEDGVPEGRAEVPECGRSRSASAVRSMSDIDLALWDRCQPLLVEWSHTLEYQPVDDVPGDSVGPAQLLGELPQCIG